MSEDAGCGISAAHYRELLRAALDAGYRVVSLACFYEDRRTPALIIRHDIDVSVATAVQMARIEHDMGVRTSYFIRVHAAGYNPFSRDNYAALRWLQDAGFDLGLHHEVGVFPLAGANGVRATAREHLQRELSALTAVLGRPIRSVAMHLPRHGTMPLTPADLDACGILYEAGATLFNEGAQFISDSNRAFKPACPCTLIGAADKIYLTAHPIWWMDESVEPERLRQMLLKGE
jgi:hypothetical protein